MWGPTLTRLSPSSPQQQDYGYQNWESGDIIILNQSSGHARTLGYQDGDFCQPQLWKHRFTLDTRGSRSPFPSPVKKRISRSSQRRNRIRKEAFFSRKKAFPSPSAPSLPFWTLLPLRPKDVDSSGILDEEAEHTETGINNKSKRVPVSVLAKFCFSYWPSIWKAEIWERTWVVLSQVLLTWLKSDSNSQNHVFKQKSS